MFVLDERLARDCIPVGELPLCSLLLMNDANYPWLILVPRVAGVAEIVDLEDAQRQQLLQESCAVALALRSIFSPDKLNIAALGNVVPQLHLHHIARFKKDKAWPKPVWGSVAAQPYTDLQVSKIVQQVSEAMHGSAQNFVRT